MTIPIENVAGLDLSDVATEQRIGRVTPGEVLREEFMAPLGLIGAGSGAQSRRPTTKAAPLSDVALGMLVRGTWANGPDIP